VTKIISVIGHKNAGKTTLVSALSHEFKRQKRRVATIKHASHPVETDRVTFERRLDDTGPEDLARRYFTDMDIVLVEGFKRAPIPKIEVYRKEVAKAPLFDPESSNAGEWVAIVTDDHKYRAPCRVLHFTDTMWLTVLTALVMEQAKPLAP
jgi:molybdopterin-guanine dinucleotide biosynthesis protein B